MRRALTLLSAMLLAVGLLAVPAALGPAAAQNPTAPGENPSGAKPTADAVNEEFLFKQGDKIQGRVSIPDQKSANLIQPQGRDYRAFHEGALPWIGAIAILGMVLALAAFFFWRGRIEQDEVSGQKIQRFNAFERFTHWMTAVSFIVLALSGLNYVFGKRLIMPLIGPDAFGTLSQLAKYSHIYLAWPFIIGVAIMLVVWVKDNIPNRVDVAWLKAGGGMLGKGHPSAYRFNAGQKVVFWMVTGFGAAMAVTGIIMMFPFSFADVNGMQTAQYVHAIVGVLFVAGILAHIYIGSLGMAGAYDAMGNGKVDVAWARAHHDLWVEEQQAKTASGPQLKAHSVPAE
jgi:formate dehydrogenase subunit gamma